MRALLLSPFLVIVSVVGCGGSVAAVFDPVTSDGGGITVTVDAGGGLPTPSVSCTPAQPQACPWNGCAGGPLATCVNGGWVCPTPTNDCNPPPPQECPGVMPDCFGLCGSAVCMDGVWTCDGYCGQDAGTTFACGKLTCAGTNVCTNTPPGVALPDGGTPQDTFSCAPLPAACASTPTCACLKTNPPLGCFVAQCDDSSGRPLVNCLGF